MAKRRLPATFDAGGERLVELGLSYTDTGWYADSLRFRCLRDPVIVTLDGGPSGIHPSQLEAIELLAGERSYDVYNQMIGAVYDAIVEWCRDHAPDQRVPSMRWVREHARASEVNFPAPGQRARGTIPPQFGLFAVRDGNDEHPIYLYFIWTGEGWMGSREASRARRFT